MWRQKLGVAIVSVFCSAKMGKGDASRRIEVRVRGPYSNAADSTLYSARR